MSGWMWTLTVWCLIGFLSCVWCIKDELDKGENFDALDAVLVVPTTFFGPIFTIWLIKENWKVNGAPVIIKGRDKNERGLAD